MHSSFHSLRRVLGGVKFVFLAAAAFAAAGCHSHNYNSGYGVAWVTLTAEPGDFASYVVNVDSVSLTDKTGNVYTALGTVEPVDLVKLGNVSELWGTATIPDDTYVSATVTLDYTKAAISVMVGGVPQKATIVGPSGAALTGTTTVKVTFDPNHPLVIAPSYATTNAVRLALDFNLPASNSISYATSPATVTVNPYMTAAVAPADTKLIRVRGPLINSSADLQTYTIYERPFYDEASNIGSLTLFNDANTVYTINGTTYVGAAGLSVLAQTSAGSTLTSAYTTFEPTTTPAGGAGKFNTVYVIAGSSLESFYTQNLSGEVIARSGDTLTLRGGTLWGSALSLANGYFAFENADSQVLLGPGTAVTAEGNATLGNLDYRSIAVGQRITAIGTYSLPSSGVVTLDATSPTAGQVRLQSTRAWGQLLAGAAGSASITLQTPRWLAGERVQFRGQRRHDRAGFLGGGLQGRHRHGRPVGHRRGHAAMDRRLHECLRQRTARFQGHGRDPGSRGAGESAGHLERFGHDSPFAALSSSALSIDLANTSLASAVIRIGPESIDLKSLAASPQVVPTAAAASATFLPSYAEGNAVSGINTFATFATFATGLNSAISATAPVTAFEARGLYDRATNTFTADTVNVVL